MATVLAFALIVFVFGVLSLTLDRDVIDEADAGPLVGVSMVVVALLVVLLITLREAPAPVIGRTVTALLAVVMLSPLVGAIAYSAVRVELGVIPVFFGRYVLSPFVLASAGIAALVVLGHAAIRSPGSPSTAVR